MGMKYIQTRKQPSHIYDKSGNASLAFTYLIGKPKLLSFLIKATKAAALRTNPTTDNVVSTISTTKANLK